MVDRAGEFLSAEAGEQLCGYFRQDGQQLDLEPELDKVRVLQVFLGQRWRVRLTKDLLKVGHHLTDVLQGGKSEEILNVVSPVIVT